MDYTRVTRSLRLLKRASALYDAMLGESAARCGVTKQEADVLVFLANNPTQDTARAVAELRGYSKAYVSKAVERLLARGYIDVTVCAADRRSQHLRITARAAETVRALQAAQSAFAKRVSDGVSAQEQAVCAAVCEKIARNIERVDEDLASKPVQKSAQDPAQE